MGKMQVSWEWLIIEQNGGRFVTRMVLVKHILVEQVHFTLYCSRSFKGHSVHFFQNVLKLENARKRQHHFGVIQYNFSVIRQDDFQNATDRIPFQPNPLYVFPVPVYTTLISWNFHISF